MVSQQLARRATVGIVSGRWTDGRTLLALLLLPVINPDHTLKH